MVYRISVYKLKSHSINFDVAVKSNSVVFIRSKKPVTPSTLSVRDPSKRPSKESCGGRAIYVKVAVDTGVDLDGVLKDGDAHVMNKVLKKLGV